MTFKDYDFLTSTMEKIVSLDIKSSTLNDEKKEIISKKTNLDDEISTITNRIEELERRKNSTDDPDSLSDDLDEQENLISKNRLDIKELKRKISKLDNKISSRTMGKTYEEWEESSFKNYSIIDLLGMSIMMGVYIIITVILGIHIFAESFNETFGEYYWYVLASFCVTFLLAFVGFLQIRAQDKKDLPDIENWEHERKNLVSDLEEIREIENEKIRAIMVLTNTIKAYESFEKNLEVEEERLESLRVPLRERLSEIEAIEAELSRINDEIVDSLESVAHLTPYNSGF